MTETMAKVHNCEQSAPKGFLISGLRQDGEKWQCPDCGYVWIHVCDEAEGCAWFPARRQPRKSPLESSEPATPGTVHLHGREGTIRHFPQENTV